MLFQRRGVHLLSLGKIKVFVSMWYGILMAFVVVLWPMLGAMAVADGILWALAITAALVWHEWAHAMAAKRKSLGPSIVLHAFGSFCITDREPASDGEETRQILAGPIAGLIAAAIFGSVMAFFPEVVEASAVTSTLIPALVWTNLIWSLFNLVLPIWPYDGGRLFHLFLRRFKDEKTARKWALNASIFAVIPLGVVGLFAMGSFILAFLAFFVVMDNMQTMKSGQRLVRRKSDREKNKPSSFHAELMEEAEEAMEREDWEEAARLGHHMRAVGSMPAKMAREVWTILGIATMNKGDYEEALRYLKRAPSKSKVKKAIEKCEEKLDG